MTGGPSVNASTCPGCGDQHLCPGRTTTGPDSTLLAAQIQAYVTATFDTSPTGIVGSQAAWEAYVHWCGDHGQVPYSNRRFVQAMTMIPGIRRIKRSTMRFAGITWKRSQVRGRHAAPEPAYT